MEEFVERMEDVISAAGEVLVSESINEQLAMTHFDRVLNVLRQMPSELQGLPMQLEALEVLLGLAVPLLPNRNQFRPLALQAIRYCLLALGHGLCPIRISIYELLSTLADVVGNEMTRVYTVINGQMEKDLVSPKCTYLERSVIDTLRLFAEDSAFKGHLQKAFDITCGSIHNHDQGIRIASVKALCSFIVAFQEHNCTTEAQRAYKSLVPTLAAILRRDSRTPVVLQVSLSLCQIFRRGLPPHSLSDPTVADPIFECIRDLMAKQMACQQDEPQLAGDVAMGGANILACYGQALDPDLFASYFKQLHGSFVQFLKETSVADHSEFYGMIDDCIKSLGRRAVPYYGFLLSILLDGFVEPDPDSRQNAYYGIGLLVCEVGPMAVTDYPEIVKALLKACGREQPGSTRDNLAGALARMIVANLRSVPLELVLPRLMFCLPISVDFSESGIVLKALRMLYEDAHSSVISYLEHMLLITVQMLHKEHVTEPECIEDGAEFVRKIRRTYPEKFDKVFRENPEINDYLRSIPNIMDQDEN